VVSDIIQTMWVGNKLSTMERLSLNSFVKNGHDVHLYTYSDVEGVPEGVEVKDGNAILPEDMIFMYKDHKSYSAFSNYFRYKLLSEKGGYWVDTDVVCLKKFDFKTPFVFCSEEVLPLNQGNTHVGSCIIKMPAGNPIALDAFETCMEKKREMLVWGEIGPRLVKQMVEKYSMNFFVKPPETFCPIPGCMWNLVLNPEQEIKFGEETYAIHLWNEMWRRSNADKDAKYPERSYYEKLKTRYL